MSYTDYITKPTSQKIVIVEIDVTEDSEFINFEPGIWFITYYVSVGNATYNFGNGAFGYGNFGSSGVATLTNDNPKVRINSFYATDEWYTKVTTLASLRTTDKSFYFDASTSRIYIHFANHDPPWCFASKKLGVSHGYSNRAKYYDDIFYAAKVASVPNITRSKDPLFFGRISFDGGTISLINTDGEFDSYESDYEIYGSVVRILLGFEDNTYADFKTMYEGYLENLQLTEEIFELDVNDKRKQLSRKLPTEVFNTTTYPDLKAKNADKPIPLGYGTILNALVICTNEDGSTPWSFKICDTTNHPIKSIDAVYVEGGTARTLVSVSSSDLSTATFTLTAGTYTAGSDTVTVDYKGYTTGGTLISNGVDIIRDILVNYFSKPYTNTFFNTTAWGSARTIAADIGIHIDEPKEGWEIIEDISYSLGGNFIVQDDGLFTFRSYDSGRGVDQTIKYWELLQDLAVAYDTDEVLTSCRIGYNKDWAENTYTHLLYNTSESIIADKFKTYRERTFDTLLTASGSATTFAENIMAISDDVRPILTVRTKMQSIDREISDMVNVEYKLENRDFVGTMSCEVIGKSVNLDDMTVELTLRKT